MKDPKKAKQILSLGWTTFTVNKVVYIAICTREQTQNVYRKVIIYPKIVYVFFIDYNKPYPFLKLMQFHVTVPAAVVIMIFYSYTSQQPILMQSLLGGN